jgi:hypothetical protein
VESLLAEKMRNKGIAWERIVGTEVFLAGL